MAFEELISTSETVKFLGILAVFYVMCRISMAVLGLRIPLGVVVFHRTSISWGMSVF
jgi:hypothetical protein